MAALPPWRFPGRVAALDAALLRVERVLAPEVPYGAEARSYGYEPLTAEAFFDGMAALGAPEGRRFLDVGCGIGTKLALALALGWTDVSGIEADTKYAALASEVAPSAHVHECDLLRFSGYADYDVVFMYRPMIHADDEVRAEMLVVSRMRAGALAFFPHAAAQNEIGSAVATHIWRVAA